MSESMDFSTALGGHVVLPVTGATLYQLRQEILKRNGLIKVLIGNLAQSGESWDQVLHRCGLANSSQGYMVAMDVAESHG
jgi:hypothetical protein